MSVLTIILRILHVVGGIVWVGSAFFSARFLMPAIQDAGPDGMKVAFALQKRGMMVFMPAVATITILSGIWLYARNSGGFNAGYMASNMGITLGIGGLLALSVFALGITVGMPAMRKAGALQKSLASRPESERAAIQAEIGRLQMRAGVIARVGTPALILAAIAMAIARYV